VACVNMADEPGSLYKILKILAEKEVNVDYMYAFSNDDVALGVIRTENIPEVTKLLEERGITLLSQHDIYQL